MTMQQHDTRVRPPQSPTIANVSEPSQEKTPDATPDIVRVMCEPVRWRSYGLLHGIGPLRAAQLAKRVSVSEASMLKHLEMLEQIGFVEADPESSSVPRHRYWRAIPGGLRLTDAIESTQPELMRQWMQVFVQSLNLVMRQWAQEEETWPLDWRHASQNYDFWMHLTSDELNTFTGELLDVARKWDVLSRHRSRVEGAKPVYAALNAFPVKE